MRNLPASLLILLWAAMLLPCEVIAVTATSQGSTSTPDSSSTFLNALPKQMTPLAVTASFFLSDINYINDETETFDFTGVLKLSWHDPRQAFDPRTEGVEEKMYLGDYQFNEVYTGWWPQVVLVNESGMYEQGGVMLRILPDGSLTLIEKIGATAKTHLNLRRYPFDAQRLEAVFTVLGFDSNEVVLQAAPDMEETVPDLDDVFRLPQWRLAGINTAVVERKISVSGHEKVKSTYLVTVAVQRKSFFFLRLVVLPMIIIVMLSWSVFWMDKSSVGDRIAVSFIGILTAVAYQMILNDIFPQISYFTLMNAFLNISFIFMCVSVIINLRVSYLDRQGMSVQGDLLDRRCRWIFPLAYFGLVLLMTVLAFTLHSFAEAA